MIRCRHGGIRVFGEERRLSGAPRSFQDLFGEVRPMPKQRYNRDKSKADLYPKPRSADVVKRQLADLAEVLASYDHSAKPDFASQVSLSSLRDHEAKLLEELKAAEWLEKSYDMELAVEGPSVNENAMPMHIMSALLDKTQLLMIATAEIATRIDECICDFSNNLLDSSQMMVKCFTPSPFAIQLIYAKSIETSSLDQPNYDILTVNGNIFLSLLSDNIILKDIDILITHPLLCYYYYDYLNFVIKNELTIFVRTRKHPYPVKLSPYTAKGYIRQIENEDKPLLIEEEFEIEGVLVMADLKEKIYELETRIGKICGDISEFGLESIEACPLGIKVPCELVVTIYSKDLRYIDFYLAIIRIN
jgi:hypothetical protein